MEARKQEERLRMSRNPAATHTVHERIAGKWQIPAFIAALGLLVAVAVQIRSPERKLPVEEHIALVQQLNSLALYDSAIARCERVLAWKDLGGKERCSLLVEAARAHFGHWKAVGEVGGDAVGDAEDAVAAYDRALQQGAKLSGRDYRNMAQAFERLKRFELAVKYYGLAAERSPVEAALLDRQRMIELCEYPLRRPREEIDAMLDEFIASAGNAPNELLWALVRRIESLAMEGEHARAGELLEANEARFVGEAQEADFAFLRALSLRGAGDYDEAERVLRDLLNHVSAGAKVYPKAGWLLGNVVMFDGELQRPEEAIAIFRNVIAARVDRVYEAASRLSMASALCALQRFEEAVAEFRKVCEALVRIPYNRLVNPDTVRATLALAADQARNAGLLPVAIDCEGMALGLVEESDTEAMNLHLTRLADAQVALGRELLAAGQAPAADEDAAATRAGLVADGRKLLVEAGENQVRRAWLNTLNEPRSSAAMWTAAGLFDEAKDHGRAISVLQRFIAERPDAEIIPQALLRLGRLLAEQGRYQEAIDAFQRNISSYPRSPFANAALIPLAECFLALGPEHEQSAELALRRIIDDSMIFTPEAPEYRDAMFLLADLLGQQGRPEEVIATLDEVLQRYPRDPRRPRAMFQMALAYFKSAQSIKDELLRPEFGGERKRLESERGQRLARAAEVFGELVALLEGRAEGALGDLEKLYLQDARLYEAACRFEQGDYAAALPLYERAAWLYKESPAALGAYVQVINCDLLLDRRDEAATALRRAQFLVEDIRDEHFAALGGLEKREEWRRYFDWVEETLIEDRVSGR